MTVKFQYNKTSLQNLNKQLDVRVRALPTLKNKESALRSEVKHAKQEEEKLRLEYEQTLHKYDQIVRLWGEFDPSIIRIAEVDLSVKKIAGVSTPVLNEVKIEVTPFSLASQPFWFYDGISILKSLAEIAINQEVFLRKMELLDYARKKTTQKVNLYEKVQIPGFEDAMRKIKRFLEDEENLSKSAQKIVKMRQQQEVVL